MKKQPDRYARYRARHPERVKAAERRWRAKNKARISAYHKARRASWSMEEKERRGRESNLRHFFSMTLAEYESLLVKQGGVCAICCKHETATRKGRVKRLAVDHNHETGAVRGLLCQNCNTLLGKGLDSIAILTLAIEYLKRHGR